MGRGFPGRRVQSKAVLAVVLATALAGAFARELQAPSLVQSEESYIVQSSDLESAAEAVRSAGGSVVEELAIIDAVTAELTEDQVELLRDSDDVRRVWRDRVAEIEDDDEP